MDEALDNRNDMRVFSSDIHHQRTLKAKEVSRQYRRLMHEQPVEFVLLEKQLDEFLAVLLAAEWRLDVEERMLRGINMLLLGES
jgi:hypothetical protein